MTVLFGGEANPIGAVVHFLEAPFEDVINALPGEWDATTTAVGASVVRLATPAALDNSGAT